MSLMLGKLYTALKDAGASEGAAEAAAAEVAGYENRLANIESELKLHRWMLGYLSAAVTAMTIKLFS